MKTKPSIIIGIFLVVFSIVIGGQSFARLFSNNKKGTFDNYISAQPIVKNPKKPLISGKPIKITINSVAIDLEIVDGFYNAQSKTWTLTGDKAQYATITPKSNNLSGNTFIYGHNNPKVFINLHKLKAGDQAIVTTDNGHKFTYVFKSTFETNPNDDSLFKYKGPAILTLQTCSGIWYENRQLFTFDLQGVA